MLFWGYSLAVIMGLILGLIGAGGSILTMPILVYFLHISPVVATGYSLLVVGTAALFGATRYWQIGKVDLKIALIFAMPAMIAVWLARKILLPALPTMMLGISKDSFIMLLFALLMVVASIFMLKPVYEQRMSGSPPSGFLYTIKLILGSFAVGLLTGMVGAGGGFLIIPSLIALFNISMKMAVGTSLAIIAMNSFVGFSGDLSLGIELNWWLLMVFITLTLIGMGIGTSIAHYVNDKTLRNGFGFLAFFVGVGIFVHELFLIMGVS
ncbi:MAG: sulfite exporter TauE/SafE family protein [Legionellaceae bacterium]|nr:sulfite exporter TauE/SafE family protein [Legionellaceae bacterium]